MNQLFVLSQEGELTAIMNQLPVLSQEGGLIVIMTDSNGSSRCYYRSIRTAISLHNYVAQLLD